MENVKDWISQIFYNGAKIIREDGSVLTGPHLQSALYERRNDPELCRSGQVSELLLQQLSAMVYGRKFLAYSSRPGDPHTPQDEHWDWVCYTSGTTGYYKAQGHTWESTMAFANSCAKHWGMNKDSVMLTNFPSTSMGLYSTSWPALISGGTVLCLPFNPYSWVHDVIKHKVTHGVLIPRQALLVSQTKSFENADLSTVTHMTYGANFMSKIVADEFAKRGMGWYNVYGSTELFGPICFSDNVSEFKNWVSGFEYYLESDGEFVGRWPGQDWIHTGDLCIEKEPGVLKMIGRKNFVFKHRDAKVQPEQIETVAKYLQTVDECLVTVEDDKLTLKYEGNVDINALKEILQQNLDPILIPSRFIRVEALPRSAMGKLIRPFIPVE